MEAAIAWLVQTILATLLIYKLDAWIRQVGLADDVEKLKSEVERVEMVIGDVRGRASRNRLLARSLARLKELLYDADDVIDELDYYRLQQQVQGAVSRHQTSMLNFINLLSLISAACLNAEKLPVALISCGIAEAAAALCLIISKTPGGIFLHHGKAPFYLYYGILVAVLIFGLIEASAGFYVSGDVVGRRAAGKTILWISILPLVVVAALGGFALLNLK